jgi:hypothetical protein
MMYEWVLIISLLTPASYGGKDIHHIEMQDEETCNLAKEKYIVEFSEAMKKFKSPNWVESSNPMFAVCVYRGTPLGKPRT